MNEVRDYRWLLWCRRMPGKGSDRDGWVALATHYKKGSAQRKGKGIEILYGWFARTMQLFDVTIVITYFLTNKIKTVGMTAASSWVLMIDNINNNGCDCKGTLLVNDNSNNSGRDCIDDKSISNGCDCSGWLVGQVKRRLLLRPRGQHGNVRRVCHHQQHHHGFQGEILFHPCRVRPTDLCRVI